MISFLINESLISAISAVEDQQEQDQQFHYSQVSTKCFDTKTVNCMQFEVINAHLSYKI